MFRSTVNRGFQMTFKNGVEISVQFGTGNYCSNRDINKPYGYELGFETYDCDNAEVAIFNGSDNITGVYADSIGEKLGSLEAFSNKDTEFVSQAMEWCRNY